MKKEAKCGLGGFLVSRVPRWYTHHILTHIYISTVVYDSPHRIHQTRDDSDRKDLRSCRDFCIRHGFSGFFVQNGYAYFRRGLASSGSVLNADHR